ncbi:SDR family NAD(P)-dependent oxidoreductase [Microbacterium sp. dk485]|uniref:SDR family NAD(P)-dependent oxidoreductase n=1 Tax=Microbacterium TaxID=33882 RepID=UPI0010735F7B|nr:MULTISPECIES: SDR family NAD(P)-dependent oxidoreductase [Microbacterium]TFV82418.1 SDR family NAD(P)-dependent oxidoreductase [Microbacterium sp. dk485]TXK20254.1 SDR family NAD(P)-dependent oxidoreductase [Microbacterium wangchenii]
MARTIVITGASDGIGAASARQLSEAGEHVVVVGRDPEKTRTVAEALDAPWHVADYSDLSQVRELAAVLTESYPRIDVLANNAGGIFGDRTVTRDGFELTFQVNHLGGFLLTNLLRDRLRESGATVIQTSSVAALRFARFDIDDLQGERRFSPGAAYGNAKLANILFTKELHRRYGDAGIHPVAFHPGAIASGFAAASVGSWRFLYTNPVMKRVLTSTEIGGSRLTWLAMGKPGVDWRPGEYYANNRVARTSRLADDPALAKMLWDRSAAMVGITEG